MFPPNFGFILPSNLISGQKPQIHTAECTNLCVYTELSRAPYNIHRSPVLSSPKILILFLLRKFDPIPVVSVFMSLPCQTRSSPCPLLAHLALFHPRLCCSGPRERNRESSSGKCISAAILTVIKCKSKSQRKPQTMFTSFIFVFQQFISLFLSSLGS